MPTDPTPAGDGAVPDRSLTYSAWLRQNPPAIRQILGWWPWLRYCWTGKLDVPGVDRSLASGRPMSLAGLRAKRDA